MKKTIFFMLLFLLAALSGITQDNDYFDVNNITYMSSFDFTGVLAGNVYFDLSEISTDYLDAAVVSNYQKNPPPYTIYFRIGTWHQNNGHGYFGNYQTPFISGAESSDINRINNCTFVKLHSSGTKEDLVVARQNKITVHWNYGYFSGYQQEINTGASILEKGDFDYQDSYEDIAIRNGNSIIIYKNLRDGYFSSNPVFSGTFQGTKFKLRQINEKIKLFFPEDGNNHADLIVVDGTNIKVFINNEINGFNSTPFADINTSMNIYALEVADINNDGYNDIIIAGQENVYMGQYGAKIYLNNSGGSINSTAIWSVFNNNYFSTIPNISVNDLNKDGFNDLIFVCYENLAGVYVNSTSGQYFGSSPDQIISNQNWIIPGTGVDKIITTDIYNMGGIALLSATCDELRQTSIKILNATNLSTNPSPPVIKGEFIYESGFYRPKIKINNRGDRDFLRYDIYKSAPSNNYVWTYTGSTSSGEYIDNTENIIVGGGVPKEGQKIFYKVLTIDQTYFQSIYSNMIYYWTHVDPPDIFGEYIPGKIPEKYFITNYPNPFNPLTKIYYNIPKPTNVKIIIYNSLGQVIKILVDKYHTEAANYHIIFDGSNLSSGVYFYEIRADSYRDVKRMLLIK